MKKTLTVLLGVMLMLLLTACGSKQETGPAKSTATKWPEKNITIIVPYPAGGSTDLTIRTLAEALKTDLGKNIIVLNKAGGGGSVGAAECAIAKPDGYTFTVANAANMSIVPRGAKISYTYKSFSPISQISNTPLAIAVRDDFPANTLKEWIEWSRKNEGKMRFGSAGANSTQQLTLDILSKKENIKTTHIAFNGAGPAVAGALGGHVETVVALTTDLLPNHKAGKLKILAVFSDTRVKELPDVPSIKELGYNDISFGVWYALVGPAGLPAEIVAKMDTAVKKAVESTMVKDAYAKMNISVDYLDSKKLASKMENIDKMFGSVLEQNKAKK